MHMSDAANLPLADGSIDGVLCHQGLQFFPDQLAVLAEVHRTLRPGGQLTVAVWGRIEDNPWPAALAAATRTIHGDDTAAGMATVCALGDPAQLATLLRSAGFERAAVETQERTATHPDVRHAVAGQLAALPSGSITDDLDVERRTQIAAEMSALLAPHTDSDGRLTVPSTSVFASAIST